MHSTQGHSTTLDTADLVDQVQRTVRRVGSLIRAVGADPEDVQQDVMLAILEAQRRPGSRYDPSRGYSPTTYLYQVARCATLNALRRPSRLRGREVGVEDIDERMCVEPVEGTDEGAMRRVFSELTDEERTMAVLLAGGATLLDARRVMGLSEGGASELRTRVKALLMHHLEG